MNIRTSILMKSSRNGGLSQGMTFLCHLNFHLNLALKEGTKMKVSVVIATAQKGAQVHKDASKGEEINP